MVLSLLSIDGRLQGEHPQRLNPDVTTPEAVTYFHAA